MPQRTCSQSQCTKPTEYEDGEKSFCAALQSYDCQLQVISEGIPRSVRIEQTQQRDPCGDLGGIGAMIAGCGEPIDNLKILFIHLQVSTKNDHYRLARLQRISFLGFPQDTSHDAGIGYIKTEWAVMMAYPEETSTQCQSHHPPPRTIAAQSTRNGEIDLKGSSAGTLFRSPTVAPYWPSGRYMKPEDWFHAMCHRVDPRYSAVGQERMEIRVPGDPRQDTEPVPEVYPWHRFLLSTADPRCALGLTCGTFASAEPTFDFMWQSPRTVDDELFREVSQRVAKTLGLQLPARIDFWCSLMDWTIRTRRPSFR
ncbi:hypothetical protein BD779DRAFT_1483053 [Infundibulicybe gibba]|nr:hypothetical protein BD779DRAFT_1483053 [Infundibulicybe gibba]